MKTFFLENELCYDGTQLRSHWIFDQTGSVGDAIATFIGPCDVMTKHMVDLVDVRNDAPIFSPSMLHVIVEHFEGDLPLGVARQRLLVANAGDLLRQMTGASTIVRRGNDLLDGDKKLSVSIATKSPISCCIHFGINIRSDGTPVATKGLADYRIDPRTFAEELMARYVAEIANCEEARCKVRAVL